jgi:hypothetical protein
MSSSGRAGKPAQPAAETDTTSSGGQPVDLLAGVHPERTRKPAPVRFLLRPAGRPLLP